MPMMTAQFQTTPGAATTNPPRPPRPRLPDGAAGDAAKALAILTGWQRAGFRGYAIAERRADRRLVVTALAAKLSAEKIAVSCLLIAADDAAAEQWHRYLSGHIAALPGGWSVQTAEAALAHGGRLDRNCVVIADEVEAYLTEDVAAAITGVRAILGLCALPNGFGEAAPFRKYLGRALDLSYADKPLDLSPPGRAPTDQHRGRARVRRGHPRAAPDRQRSRGLPGLLPDADAEGPATHSRGRDHAGQADRGRLVCRGVAS
jgi:hypothetical protein